MAASAQKQVQVRAPALTGPGLPTLTNVEATKGGTVKSWVRRVPVTAIVGGVVFLVVALSVLIAVLATSRDRRYPKAVCEGARNTMQQAAQWTEQDGHPLLRLTHANYAIAQVNALRTLMSDNDIERVTKIKPKEMLTTLKQQQAAAIRAVVRKAPSMAITSQMGAAAGWR